MNVLEIKNLGIQFIIPLGSVSAVKSLSFEVQKGECLGVVGESGCGKTVVNLALLGLLPSTAQVTAEIFSFGSTPLLHLDEKRWQKMRGQSIAMIFQDPMSALNPCFTILTQLDEVIRKRNPNFSRKQRSEEAVNLLVQVGISEPRVRLQSYPHELSGGMAQRVMIAMALAGEPDLLIADEPTTALDISIQTQILELLTNIRHQRNMAMILVTHNIAVAAAYADRIQVMYAGEIVESGRTKEVLSDPRHPYTLGLLNSLPGRPGQGFRSRLRGIGGAVPSSQEILPGCQFAPRCSRVQSVCSTEHPCLQKPEVQPYHLREVRCFFPGDES